MRKLTESEKKIIAIAIKASVEGYVEKVAKEVYNAIIANIENETIFKLLMLIGEAKAKEDNEYLKDIEHHIANETSITPNLDDCRFCLTQSREMIITLRKLVK